MTALLVLLVLVILTILMTVKVIPQQSAYILERLGKFYGVLQPGIIELWVDASEGTSDNFNEC